MAVLVLFVFMFFQLGLAAAVPSLKFSVVFAAVVAATAIWMDRTEIRVRGLGAIEVAMALYLMWNVYSMLAPHKYAANEPLLGVSHSVPKFILTGLLTPFLMYLVGRYTFDRIAAVRLLMWTILSLAAYSAWVSIAQFYGPTALVWPRFIVDGSIPPIDTWPDRAIGVFNQPVVNGLILVLGFAVAMLMMSRRSEPAYLRYSAIVIAVGCGAGIYLTHTRVVWLIGVLVIVIGVLAAKGFRKGFVVALGVVTTVVAINWSAFTSSDRNAGGVGSVTEVEDRLNMIQTGLWAFAQKPIFGWGIRRFVAVNTYHHQQWSPETPFVRGYGIASHLNELGILAELGVIGLAFWIAVLVLIAYRLWDAYRTLPDDDLCGKPLVLIAIMAFAILFCVGLTVDLRLFNFAPGGVFLLAGIAIGWSDRHRQGLTPGDDSAGKEARASPPTCGPGGSLTPGPPGVGRRA